MVKRFGFLIFTGIFAVILYAQTTHTPIVSAVKEKVLAQQTLSLEDRYRNTFVNTVFKENILLTLSYLSGQVHKSTDIKWDKIDQSSRYNLTLLPGEIFAFHDQVLPQYQKASLVTTNAHFDGSEGFLSDGDLYGDGVCHLASLLNWVASDAGLSVVAPTNHNFANIPDVPMRYGTAIYASPTAYQTSALQNLYIKNTFDKSVHILFAYANGALHVSISRDL